MTPDHTDSHKARLDALLHAARNAAPPGDDLVARVLADAAAVQASASTRATARSPEAASPKPMKSAAPTDRFTVHPMHPRRRWAMGLVAALGGWPSVSGVTAAGLIGLAVGFAAPDVVDGWPGGDWRGFGDRSADTMPDIGALWVDPLPAGSDGGGDGDV